MDPGFALWWTVGLVSILAGGVAAVSGFGIGSLLTPVLLGSFVASEAVALVAIPHAVASTVRWFRLRADIDWVTFRQFGVASATGGLIGALLASRLGSPALTGILGLLMLMAGGSELMDRRLPLPRSLFCRLFGGALSGVFGGLVGNQGGVRSAALLGFRLSPRQLVATSTASAVLVDLARVPIYTMQSGEVLRAQVPLMVLASVGVLIGTFLGVPLLGRIPRAHYRWILGALLMVIGLSLLIRAVP